MTDLFNRMFDAARAADSAAAATEPKPSKERAPYREWCRDPKACAGKGYCPKDPTCGD